MYSGCIKDTSPALGTVPYATPWSFRALHQSITLASRCCRLVLCSRCQSCISSNAATRSGGRQRHPRIIGLHSIWTCSSVDYLADLIAIQYIIFVRMAGSISVKPGAVRGSSVQARWQLSCIDSNICWTCVQLA